MVTQEASPLMRMAHALGRLDSAESALGRLSERLSGYEQERLEDERAYIRASITDIQEAMDALIASGVRV